jgi:hypothetical protein
MNKFKPALLGGLIVGVLSAIPLLNYCLLHLGYRRRHPGWLLIYQVRAIPVKVGEGAVIGVLTGIVGAVLYFIIGVPLAYFISGANLEETLARMNVQLPANISGLLLFALSGLIGGLDTPLSCRSSVDSFQSRSSRNEKMGRRHRRHHRITSADLLTNDLRKTGFRRS